jgi:hypothetical protein
MRQVHQLVLAVGNRVDGRLVVITLLALNISWLIMLRAIGGQFEEVAGVPLLDLQNEIGTDAMMTPDRMTDQIASYTQGAKTLYWSFFILDNIMPPLTFGVFSLLWVRFFRSHPGSVVQRLVHSYALLIPLGVGFFDWIENLGYITAIHDYPAGGTTAAIVVGLTAKWIKAAFLQLTFLGTWVLLIRHLALEVRQFVARRKQRALKPSV